MERPVDISVIVPIYHGADHVDPLLERLLPVLSDYGRYEVIFVDDASGDDTWERLKVSARRYPAVRGLRLAVNAGQQQATLCGVRCARGEKVITMDDDLQHRPEDIPKLTARLSSETDLIFAVPVGGGGGLLRENRSLLLDLRRAGSRLRTLIFRLAAGRKEAVRPTSFRAFTHELAEGLRDCEEKVFYLSVTLSRGANGIGHVEVPAAAGHRASRYRLGRLVSTLLTLLLSFPRLSKAASFLSSSSAEDYEVAEKTGGSRLLIVGGGAGQLFGIRRARELGYTVAVSDANPAAPGAQQAERFFVADTFDAEETAGAAREFRADGVVTYGTDQPVLTVARAAERLGLPQVISSSTALAVTNKRVMKRLFSVHGIPTCGYRIVAGGLDELSDMRPPYVLKPVDSQGQRGVVKLRNSAEARERLSETLSYSREGSAVIEEYYEGGEVTFSGWVLRGTLYPLTLTDRVTITRFPHIGVCVSHNYPSRFSSSHGEELMRISRRIVESFGIESGPVYIQMLVGEEGVKVNEVACRIGGAYEDEFIPHLTGVDLHELAFAEAVSGEPSPRGEKRLREFRYPAPGALSVLLFFTRPLIVASTGDTGRLRDVPGIVSARYLLSPGESVGPMENSTGRAGYVIVEAEEPRELNRRIREVYRRLAVYDAEGRNMLADYSKESLHIEGVHDKAGE